MTDEEKKAAIAKVVAILKSHDIEMRVDACGCCESPWVKFSYKGEEILDDEEAGFDTSKTP